MRCSPWAILAAVSLALGACEKLDEQRSRLATERAEQQAANGDYEQAIRFYEEALDGREATAELHYKMALIHDDRLKNPVSALHHFRRYLALEPNGKYARDARGFIKEDELKVITMLATGGLMTQREAAGLRNENLGLRTETAELRARLKALMDARRSEPGAHPTAAARTPLPAGTRRYVVEPGDTLAAISRKFYKTSARWKDIQDANFNALKGTVNLKPGMELIIPE